MSKALIERLDSWLKVHRPGFYEKLQPGLSDRELAEFETRLGFELPETFKDLYSWKNGQSPDCMAGFQFNYSLMRLADIESTREILRENKSSHKEPDWWDEKWIPILDNGGGDNLCVDMAGSSPEGTPGQIITFWHDWEVRSIQYPKLETLLSLFVESLEKNMWIEKGNDFHPRDDDNWSEFVDRALPRYPMDRTP